MGAVIIEGTSSLESLKNETIGELMEAIKLDSSKVDRLSNLLAIILNDERQRQSLEQQNKTGE